MRHSLLRECGCAIAILLAILLLYGGAYLAMMERTEHHFGMSMWADGKIGPPAVWLDYRFGGEWSRTFFGPAHEADRRLRPDLWQNELIRRSRKKGKMPPVHVEIRDAEESP
jgi:hypothetical protein